MTKRTTPAIQDALEEMHHRAFCAFYAVERFGKDSPEHQAAKAAYENARYNYEWYCAHAGIPAYATHDAD